MLMTFLNYYLPVRTGTMLARHNSSAFTKAMASVPVRPRRAVTLLVVQTLLLCLPCIGGALNINPKQQPINFYYLPETNDNVYSRPGDINIGNIVNIARLSKTRPYEVCAESVMNSSFVLEGTESVAFAVDMINRDPTILPNVTLGFYIRGACGSTGVNIATSQSFLPRAEKVCIDGGVGGGGVNQSHCFVRPKMAESTTDSANSADDSAASAESQSQWLTHDVIGIMSPSSSAIALPVSSLYSVARLPIVGYISTHDDLSNKRKHPYYFRIIPPDVYQTRAILRFIATNGWSYISILYKDDDYGHKANENMYKNSDRYGICISTSHVIGSSADYEKVADDLLLNSRARVVVIFIKYQPFHSILQAVVDKNSTGHFVWIASDVMTSYPGYDYKGISHDPAIGTFTFQVYTTYIAAFYQYVRQVRLWTTENPWLKPLWEYLFDCHYDRGTCALETDVLQSSKYRQFKSTSLRIDAVLTFAQAAHNLLAETCPNARGEEARACITGELLRDYLQKVDFEGYNGRVRFDENQDVKGRYIMSQLVEDNSQTVLSHSGKRRIVEKPVGFYDVLTDSITFFNQTRLSWSHVAVLDRIVPLSNDSTTPRDVPESVCSRPCLVGEYKIEKEVPCCWECRRCRDNEYLVNGNTSCKACPPFMWPDPHSAYTTCEGIPSIYNTLEDTLPAVLAAIAVLALLLTLAVSIAYIIYRHERVVKASSRELSSIQLVAIFTGYSTVLLFQTKPTRLMCIAIFFMFCMSFALLYSPLLVKTIRIVRIFKSSKNNKRPQFISPQSQLIFTSFLIAGQIALCVLSYVFYHPDARRTQPVWSEKVVDLSCDLTLVGLGSFLGYNFVLVALCSVFAFMVRKLPDNFNESKFIFMCVTTTLLIWMAFIPTYFTASRGFVRVFLLSMALLMNHTVALVFLFLPKIYAATFLPQESGPVSKIKS